MITSDCHERESESTASPMKAGSAGRRGRPVSISNNKSQAHWLIEGGEMGKLIRSMDWTRTPLGPIESWPQSLRTTVSLCLASNFPISLAWGPRHVQIYNDGYWPICGGKHPQSMGQDFTECWASPWPVIEDAFTRARAGETSYIENQRMFLDRNGYLEETFFTFSFSPIRDETGGVGGLFHPVTETTIKMLSERRTRALRDLAARAGKAQDVEEAFTLAAQTLADWDLDLPFVLFYVVDSQGDEARLVTQKGLAAGSPASPRSIGLSTPGGNAWPLAEVFRSKQTQQVDDLETKFGSLPCGPYPESPSTALVLPIIPPGCGGALGFLVAGVSARLPLNEAYRAFYDLAAAGVTAAVASARAYSEERKRAEALAEIDRAKTAFFSNVSHEFRTPLTLILGPLEEELAESHDPLPPARRERLEMAHRNSLRLLRLVNMLLDFSRIEAGRIQASYEPTDLAGLTLELVSVFRSAVEKAGLTLNADCPPMPEPVYVDREMWEKIVLNLLSNAFKHTFDGSINVTLRWRASHVEMTVADSGVGIPAAELPRLFERFYRVKGTKSRTHEGTGIGLALVKELVALHGGKIVVESKEGQGSIFAVTIKTGREHLPPDRVEAARTITSTATRDSAYIEEALRWLPNSSLQTAGSSIACAADGAALSKGAEPGADARKPRVLWADDNADLRSYVSGLLAPYYAVEAVADGEMALDAVLRRPPDIILTDVMMPRLDGFGLLRELRSDPRTRTIPVILLSARAGEESAAEGLDAGADDYLAKPFSARDLLTRVRTHLRLARLRRESALDLEAANKELEAFSYSVSHDLRAPLRTMDGFSQALLEDFGSRMPEDARRYLRMIRKGAERMSALIDDLLSLSLLSRQILNKQKMETAALVRHALRDLDPEQRDRRVEIKVGSLPPCVGDPALLKQVWINLLSNALKYTRGRDPAVVEIDSRMEGKDRVFFVRDNGAGFDMAYADKLFGVFQRLHREDEFEGTGVGLAIVHRIVRHHGGRVWAEAAVDQGATFYFTLAGGSKE